MHAHRVLATRLTGTLGEAHAREVAVPIETAAGGGHDDDALSPLELLLAAVAGGVLAGVEQAAATLSFQLGSASVEVCGVCAGRTATAGLGVEYDLTVETSESDGRLVQFHELVRHGEVLLELGSAVGQLTGRVRRRAIALPSAPSPSLDAQRAPGAETVVAAAASRRP